HPVGRIPVRIRMVEADLTPAHDVRQPREPVVADPDGRAAKREGRGNHHDRALASGQRLAAGPDGEFRAGGADPAGEPAVLCLSALLNAEGCPLTGRQALDLLELVEGEPEPGALAGHGRPAPDPNISGPAGGATSSIDVAAPASSP